MREHYVPYFDSLYTSHALREREQAAAPAGERHSSVAVLNNPGARIITPTVSRQIVRFVAAGRRTVRTRNGPRESDGDWEDGERAACRALPFEPRPPQISKYCLQKKRLCD
jgi:hypothetical protein